MNPFPIVMALFRRNRATVLLFIGLVMLAVVLGVAISAQERALRQGSARAADRFDLIVGAPGSQTELLMNIVYLQPSAVELLKPEILARLLAEPKAELVAPIGYGDSVKGFSVVGTTAQFVGSFVRTNLPKDACSQTETEAVVGASSPFRLGETIVPVHGHGEGARASTARHDEHAGESHRVDLTIVGRMAPTGTPWDAAIMVPVEQVWHVHGLPTGHAPGDERIGPPFDPAHLPGVPAVVVKPDTVPTAYGLRSAYRTEDATAFFPGRGARAALRHAGRCPLRARRHDADDAGAGHRRHHGRPDGADTASARAFCRAARAGRPAVLHLPGRLDRGHGDGCRRRDPRPRPRLRRGAGSFGHHLAKVGNSDFGDHRPAANFGSPDCLSCSAASSPWFRPRSFTGSRLSACCGADGGAPDALSLAPFEATKFRRPVRVSAGGANHPRPRSTANRGTS